ncbi:DUF1120 domain-containing protein [Pseudomonas migulae]|jgi:hypothetical protein|uniref:DUF1120 domain-containing protein n=1 Tax=Pseudomonas migulae TaxID=78543 RepID=UPI003720074E
MERCSRTLLTTLLITSAPAAIAASNTELSVTGTITPSACDPVLSNGGVVGHGKVTVRDLNQNPTQPTRLQTGEMQLEVHCEGTTYFTLTTLDNREGSSAINPAFHGLGLVNDTEKLGSVSFRLFDPLADSKPVQTILSRDGGGTWMVSSYLGHAGMTAFATQGGPPHFPVAMRNLSARLRAFTFIAPTNDLTVLDELPIDGHVTLQLEYW